MKKIPRLPVAFFFAALFFSLISYSQSDCTVIQVSNTTTMNGPLNLSYWFGVMEIPFLFLSVFFAFATALAMKGGRFGRGMKWIAWGFLIMAVGHLHMQIEHLYGFNLFKWALGDTGGSVAWFIALVITWCFSGLGFYSIYKASKGQ
jgi:hypothetical protein